MAAPLNGPEPKIQQISHPGVSPRATLKTSLFATQPALAKPIQDALGASRRGRGPIDDRHRQSKTLKQNTKPNITNEPRRNHEADPRRADALVTPPHGY